ncbi:hypothetical protein VDG15_10860 [Xanthomonas campestris pv. raphani]|nr:hypothetical protein [Xanthomonas campestris pv. raphani]
MALHRIGASDIATTTHAGIASLRAAIKTTTQPPGVRRLVLGIGMAIVPSDSSAPT